MPILEVDHVSRHFGGVRAVNDVSFSVEAGEILGIIGPNGAGKTTLFNLISGFLRPSTGDVRFEGVLMDDGAPVVLDLGDIGEARREPALAAGGDLAAQLGAPPTYDGVHPASLMTQWIAAQGLIGAGLN